MTKNDVITLKHENFEAEIELNDTKTAKAIKKALPIKAGAEKWQEEIYFEIPVGPQTEDRRLMTAKVKPGDVAYWPPGKCFCVFFGETRPVSAVTVIGTVKDGLGKFRSVKNGDEISLS